jgi:hypothetical protein
MTAAHNAGSRVPDRTLHLFRSGRAHPHGRAGFIADIRSRPQPSMAMRILTSAAYVMPSTLDRRYAAEILSFVHLI